MKINCLRIDEAINAVNKYRCNMKHWKTGKIVDFDQLPDAVFCYDEIVWHEWELHSLNFYTFTEIMDVLMKKGETLSEGTHVHWVVPDREPVELIIRDGILVNAAKPEHAVDVTVKLYNGRFLLT